MLLKMTELEKTQMSYEQRFNCIVCLCPKLEMVYGSCQHSVCADCLYEEDLTIKISFNKCPTCLKKNAFPVLRPQIPEDNIENQKCLGVRRCTHTGCKVSVWEWELEEHLSSCPNRSNSKMKKKVHRNSEPSSAIPEKRSKSERRLRRKTISSHQSVSRLRPRRQISYV